ncbi:MAG: 6-phosphogluconolactonase [Nevskia sp.]|nr:6-phosphogluconolactonase [Nevskia sp.]
MSAEVVERRFGDAAASAEALAQDVAAALREGLRCRARASMILSGGRSPLAFLQALAQQPLEWAHVYISLVDERWVDPPSPDSNEHLLRQSLLSGAVAEAHFVPLKTAAASPAEAIAERTRALEALPRPFDAVVLGMGEDGHTASLFPDATATAAALDPGGKAVLTAVQPSAAEHPRLSFTLAGLLDARGLYLQIQGEAKHRVYEEARQHVTARLLPIAAVLRQTRVPVYVYLID